MHLVQTALFASWFTCKFNDVLLFHTMKSSSDSRWAERRLLALPELGAIRQLAEENIPDYHQPADCWHRRLPLRHGLVGLRQSDT